MEIIIKIEIDNREIKDLKVEKVKDYLREITSYEKVFDECSPNWTKDAEYNKMFLQHTQVTCNDLLRAKGYIFLNDVYDKLGLPKTKAGQVVGWVYDKDNPISDSYVDFGLKRDCNNDFINGITNVARLDFNVDGNILDRI